MVTLGRKTFVLMHYLAIRARLEPVQRPMDALQRLPPERSARGAWAFHTPPECRAPFLFPPFWQAPLGRSL